jgi:hypothetical protein
MSPRPPSVSLAVSLFAGQRTSTGLMPERRRRPVVPGGLIPRNRRPSGTVVAGCVPVAIDVEALLRRVVADVFDANVDVAYSTDPRAPHVHRVRLTDPSGTRHAGLRASYEWFDASIFDLGVSTTLYDYDDEEKDKEAVLRALALVVRAHLRGEGCIEHRRGLVRSRLVSRIMVDNREWELGRRSSRPHHPD